MDNSYLQNSRIIYDQVLRNILNPLLVVIDLVVVRSTITKTLGAPVSLFKIFFSLPLDCTSEPNIYTSFHMNFCSIKRRTNRNDS